MEQTSDIDPTLVDRLLVTDSKIDGMIRSVLEVIDIDDPVNKILYEFDHPNGMHVVNRVVPFGNILIIYESRPDVTIEAAVSAFKAGNRILLKGGKEARFSNLALVQLWKEALKAHDLNEDLITYLDIDREKTQKLLRENSHQADLIIPRGGDGLINYIKNNTDVPLLVSGRGNNFVYVHEDADFDMAAEIIKNGKSRLSVCNATDKVLIHSNTKNLKDKTEQLISSLLELGLTIYTDGDFFNQFAGVSPIPGNEMYYEEFLSEKILLSLTTSVDEAIHKINTYSGGHSASIVTNSSETAEQFQNEVDCAAVYHNASTRFTDGGQFGFGAEIAISTQKLHFRGPIGLAQLVTNKWFISGNGQIRA